MNLAAPIIARLNAQVPALNGLARGAADLAALMLRQSPAPQPVMAHVIPLGMGGGPNTAVSGWYRQTVSRRVAVILSVRATDPVGEHAIASAEDLIEAIVEAIIGWTPDNTTAGLFALNEAALIAFEGGTLVYQIVFSLADEVRTAP